MDQDTLDVQLMGREYRVACPPGQRDSLLSAVAYVDAKMRELAEKSRGSSGERLAVMTALNLAHELLELRNSGGFDLEAARRRIQAMAARIDEAVAEQDRLF